LNEQTTYQTWEFLYDPRIEQLKAKAALLGGAPSSSSGSFGSGNPSNLNAPSMSSPTSPMTPTTPTTPPGSTPP
jgi:hypothetical protein